MIVLAAGRGKRFLASGGATHKLAALMDGKTVLQHTLAAVHATGLPYHVVHPIDTANLNASDNTTIDADTQLGMGDSISRGVCATPHANGWLILPADLPRILPNTILAVANALRAAQQPCAVAQAYVTIDSRSRAAHPVGFTTVCQGQLLALQGDEGARSVVAHYKALGTWQSVMVQDAGAWYDIDTVSDLERLHWQQKT